MATKYGEIQKFVDCALEGYVASNNGEFPPVNPYAICGVQPGEEDQNPAGAAWFRGYWARAYSKLGEPKVPLALRQRVAKSGGQLVAISAELLREMVETLSQSVYTVQFHNNNLSRKAEELVIAGRSLLGESAEKIKESPT